MPLYEVHGVADIKAALGVGDIQITGIASTHVEIQSYYDLGRVLYSIGAVPAFPADWKAIEKSDQVLVFLNGGVQVNLRKLIYQRDIDGEDISATVSVEEVNIS